MSTPNTAAASIAEIQSIVGTTPDSKWGPKSQTALNVLAMLAQSNPDAPWTSVASTPGPVPTPSVYTDITDLYHDDDFDQPGWLTKPFTPQLIGVPAAIHKATENLTITDPLGKARRLTFIAAGGLWGWYHFSGSGNPADQADHFLQYISGNYTAKDLVVLDFENSSDGSANMTAKGAQQWIDAVTAALGCRVCVYGSNLLQEALQANPAAFPNCSFWVAKYSSVAPTLPGGRVYSIWQWSEAGRANGQPFDDADRFLGTLAQLQATWPNLPA